MDQKENEEKDRPKNEETPRDDSKDTETSGKQLDFTIKPVKVKVRKYNLRFPEDGMF